MIVSSRPLFVLDQFRVPYTIREEPGSRRIERLTDEPGEGRELLWVRSSSPVSLHSFMGVPFVGAVASVEELDSALQGRPWEPGEEILDHDGTTVCSVMHLVDGSVVIPFDPDDLIWGTLAERYAAALNSKVERFARPFYYRLRKGLPRSLQLMLRRRYMVVQDLQAFPHWPAETGLHDILAWMLRLVARVAAEPVPWIAPWPGGARWALVLTHDVERKRGYDFVENILDVERSLGVRSAWYFVPERDYTVSDERVRGLADDGFEVGLHGLRHDGRDLHPARFEERLPSMRSYADRWNAVGFRSPSTLRSWDLVPRLGLDYDSSFLDVARYEPIHGGSCTWLPFFIGDTVELPITMPMDHTLFELLGHHDETAWLEKAGLLKEQGGMALLVTHPDYLLEPERLGAYQRFLEAVKADPTVWIALPREVSAWWRARSASTLVRTDARNGWEVRGELADSARVMIGQFPHPPAELGIEQASPRRRR